MSEDTLYIEHIVPIFSKGQKIGIGFLIKKEGDVCHILTCNHFLHTGKDYKEQLAVGNSGIEDSFKSEINTDSKSVVLGQGVDLAVIKIKSIDDKREVFLQNKVHDDSLTISTYTNISDDKNSFIHKNIETNIIQKTHLYHGIDYDAFVLKVGETLESGYSGSPVFDTKTHNVIGILSIKEGEDRGYAIDIKNVQNLLDDIDVLTIEDNTDLDYEENLAQVFFEYESEGHYKIRINQKELFDDEAVDVKKKQHKIIDEINHYRHYIDDDTEREEEIEVIELFIPHQLFDEEIAQWTDSNEVKLVDECEVFVRNIDKVKQASSKQIKDMKLWNQILETDGSFKDLSIRVHGARFVKDKNKLSAYIENKTDGGTPFDKIAIHCRIAVWIKDCDYESKYSDLLKDLFPKEIKSLPSSIRTEIANRSDLCSSNVNLMWDDPNTIAKVHYE